MISVIIPTYNSEKTIRYCLDSVLIQSFRNFECLVVDYPGKDNSRDAVLEYCKKDNRIHYIESKNKGAMAQREYGIKKARGDYICFVDSDDAIHKDYLKVLLNNLTSTNVDLSICEMIKCDFSTIEKNSNITASNIPTTTIIKGKQYKKMLADYRNNIGSPTPVCIMARKRIFVDATKYYNKNANITYWEDSILSYYLFFNSSSAVFSKNKPLYYYVKNDHSINNIRLNQNRYFLDCIKVSFFLNKIIGESHFKTYNKQSSIYSVFGSISYLIYTNNAKFRYVYKTLHKYIKRNNIRICEKEFSLSETLLCFSLKYKNSFIAKCVIKHVLKSI